MSDRALIAYARIEAAKANIEAMKAENKQRELLGHTTFHYTGEHFWAAQTEIESAITEFFKNG